MMRVLFAQMVAPIKGKIEEQHERAGLYTVKDASGMTDWALKWHMCDAGPDYCGKCGLCAYGREYERRGKSVEIEGITRDQIMEKYGASSADMAASVGRMKPIGRMKVSGSGRQAYIYNEQKAVHALAGLWRGRAAYYRDKVKEWEDKAKAAERKAAGL